MAAHHERERPVRLPPAKSVGKPDPKPGPIEDEDQDDVLSEAEIRESAERGDALAQWALGIGKDVEDSVE